MDIVRVTWTDAAFDLTDEEIGLHEVETLGWLLHRDEELVRVAGERIGDTYRGITVIPVVNVTDIETMEYNDG